MIDGIQRGLAEGEPGKDIPLDHAMEGIQRRVKEKYARRDRTGKRALKSTAKEN
jgi:hypothetical protein